LSATRASANANRIEKTITGNIAPSAAAFATFCGTRSTNHCAIDGAPAEAGVAAADAAGGRSAIAADWSIWIVRRTGAAIRTVTTATTARSATATTAARHPARAIAPDEASDPTLAISIEATSGSTVIRIRLTKIVPIGAATATIIAAIGEALPETAKPTRNPATRPISTREVNDTPRIVAVRSDNAFATPGPPFRVDVRLSATLKGWPYVWPRTQVRHFSVALRVDADVGPPFQGGRAAIGQPERVTLRLRPT
jgi:hypothetical protein